MLLLQELLFQFYSLLAFGGFKRIRVGHGVNRRICLLMVVMMLVFLWSLGM